MSWIIIFILMIAFWPLGLLLLLKKLNVFARSKKKAVGWTSGHPSSDARYAGPQQHGATYHAAAASRGNGTQNKDSFHNAENAARDAAREAESIAREIASDITKAARDIGNAARQAIAEVQADMSIGTKQPQAQKSGTWRSATSQSQAWQSMGTMPGQSATAQTRPGQARPSSAKQTGVPVSQTSQQYSGDAWSTAPSSYREKTRIKKERTALEKKSGKFVSVVLLLISLALFALGANTTIGAARDIWGSNALSRWPDFYLGIFLLIGGLISFSSRNIGVKRYARYKRYYVFVSGRSIVPITDIAQAAGASARVVRRDIQAMINEGYLNSDAYIDKARNCLVLVPDYSAGFAGSDDDAAGRVEPITDESPENQYMAIIQELREINYAIVDYSISGKIDHIEEVTAKIFRIVEENPDKQPQIRRFMNYYLPTTLKLLRSYATLEKQGIKGENITSAKQSIESVLDTLATGYEQQLDQLFISDALDIAADINVLENLMVQDGLKGSKTDLNSEAFAPPPTPVEQPGEDGKDEDGKSEDGREEAVLQVLESP